MSFARMTFMALFSIVCAAAATAQVANTSYVTPSGERVLQHEGIVAAPLAEVWRAFTTSEGLRSFAAPVAQIDFKIGGIWEASYKPEAKIGDPANIRNEIIAYVPMRSLTVRVVNAPPDFPHPDVIKNVWTTIELQDLGMNRTRVTSSMSGWKSGPAWDAVYSMFDKNNAYVLTKLQKRFAAAETTK